jgi:hypothetical protein
MNEVEIPLKITGIGAMKAELRDLKGAIADATDPKQMAELSARAGELKDKIGDANAAVNVFASGSKFEQVSNSIGGIKDSLLSLDFEEAQQKAQVFSQVLGKLNPADLAKGFGGLMGTMKTVGGAFVKLGATILANPIFLLVAAIVAIVIGIGFLLKKMGVLDAIMKVIMIPIQAMIDAFYALTDALGLTSHAEEEAAEVTKKAEEDKRAAIDESYGNRQKLFNLTKDMSAEEIKMMEDQLGVRIDTSQSEFDIEREKQEELKASYERQIATLDAITEAGGELTEEQIKDRAKLVTGWKDSNKAIESNEANRAKAIVDINRKQNDQLTAWKLKNITDDNVRAKEQFKLDEQQALAELEKNITRAKQLKQDTSGFEATRVQIKQFYAGEAAKVDARVAKQQSDAAVAANKEAQSRAKEQQAEYEKLIEGKLKKLKDANQKEINLTKEGTQARVDAEVNALAEEVKYMEKNQKTLKLSNDQLFNIAADYDKKKRKLQDDFDVKQKNLNNTQAKAEAESLVLNAKTEEEKLAAKEAVLKATAKIELANKELTAIEIKNIEDKLTNDIEEIETARTNLKIVAAKKILDAEQLAAETKQANEAFALERFKGTIDEEIAAQQSFLATQLSTLEKQRLTELANKELTAEQIAAIEQKYDQAKIVAAEATAEKLAEIDAKARAKTFATIDKGVEDTKNGLNVIASLQQMNTDRKLKGVEKGSKEEEKILKQQFEQQKAMQLAMAAINGAQAILAILSVPDFTLGVSSGLRIAASVAATAASISAIASTTFTGGGSAPSAVDPTGGSTPSTGGMATPAVSLFGSANQLNNVGAPQDGQGGNNITVTAIVSETEMTNTQNRVNKIQRNAEL